MRVYDWDPIRAEHYGQRPHRPHKQAAHMTAPDQCCSNVRKFLPKRRPHVTQSGHEVSRIVLSLILEPSDGEDPNHKALMKALLKVFIADGTRDDLRPMLFDVELTMICLKC
jgi:hypothetical protein